MRDDKQTNRALRKFQRTGVLPLKIPRGKDATSKLDRRIAVTRVISIHLMDYFQRGEYRSPENLEAELNRLAKLYHLRRSEIDLERVHSFLSGVVEIEDYESPMRTYIFSHFSAHERTEETARQAATTIIAKLKKA